MKVTYRIALSHTILVALMAGLLAYQIVLVRQMQATIARNAGQKFPAALDAMNLMRDCDALGDSARRYFAGPSPELQNQFKTAQENFANGVAKLQSDSGSDKERLEAERLTRFWRDFLELLIKTPPLPERQEPKARPAGARAAPPELEEQLERLRAQSYSLYQASLQTLNLEAESARKTGANAVTLLWTFALIALVAGSGISFLVVRSVAAPLRHLAEGTRALSEGKEFYRLDTSRSDEFSQIAKDFNTLVRRLQPENSE